ncbi:MAG: hypothetical protein JXB07_21815 [Anaerolineae bacterium]|nr:hypothetical protein [Anaerolineae bacterium]
MTDTDKPWNTEAHWLTQELLARYSDLERAGVDASQIYPNVAEHLKQCEICRAVLEELVSACPECQPPNREGEHQEAQSAARVQLVIPLTGMLDSQQADMSFWASQRSTAFRSGGRLLYYDTVPLSTQQLVVKFTLYLAEKPGHYLFEGELYGSNLPTTLGACLYISSGVCYYANNIRQDKLTFEDIPLDESVESVEIILLLSD